MNLQPLVVPAENPALILDDLERAISGECALLPLPSTDHARARVLRASQRAGEHIENTALVMATSGSTGEPKGAMLSPANLVSSADATHKFLGGAGQWLLALPGHHIAGIQVLIRSLIAGVEPLCLDLRTGFHISAFAQAARELKATDDRVYTSLVPNQLVKAMDTLEGIEALRLFDAILVGGAAVGPDTLRAARELDINVVTTYGSSETSGGCVYNGKPIPGAQVRTDSSGRIHLGGPMVAHGYRNVPDSPAFATPGWFATSDLGTVVDGTLVVSGRLDNVIITGGLKIQPEVVENAMLAVRGVREVCVLGVPDPRLGQKIVAAYSGAVSPGEVISGLDDLQRWQLPREIKQVEALPLIGPGKVDRRKVANLFG
ncbi:o-succinylbenzoate--CoA ligase [Corynebacterium epidermidicanis]|uniref:Acyl-CoA synthetase (AMP-forming)/AMP-acid ligase II n=1 Tax=Corynebacterium epidermidicanis TaxID=1050174 RepID=A0A0G3GRS2_9CORY|nr:o-succinylbenzoate--CoA ligase [Corynebacterium epidermidicanis]AKK02233.1 acyl-CoA synthetase (AMP-forming)/AMP-acid ligase II [Corynebacterium epidermidicanis]